MQTTADLLAATIRKLAAERIEALRDSLERPIAEPTMHNYAAGHIYGLRQLQGLIEEAQTEIEKR